MKKSTIIYGVLAFIAIVLLVGGCSSYNGMKKASIAVDEAWGNVNAAYQRRFDLIPNLVSTVKGYAKHEKETLQGVTDARTGITQRLAQTGDSLVAQQEALSGFGGPDAATPSPQAVQALDRALSVYVNAVHEAYPDLKANVNFLDLQKQLESTENRINTERSRYNGTVKAYNEKIGLFPGNIFAGLFGFQPKQMFQADAGAQKAPTVSFD